MAKKLWKQVFGRCGSFLLNYRDVMKLKYTSFGTKHLITSQKCISRFICMPMPLTFSKNEKSITILNVSSLCYMSRWTRYSTTGIFASPASRKKHRNELISEKLQTRILLAKKETTKNVHKKMTELKENILTVPNALCVLRICSTPVLAYLVLSEFYVASLSVFMFAGFTDLIDGYIARNFQNQQSMIGSFLDPAADKLLIATLFITLTMNNLIPVPLTSMIILRDACLMGAGFYIRYVSLPPPKTLTRYFDMSFVTAKLSPTAISKGNTLIQLSLVGASLAAPVFGYIDHISLQILWYITGTTTILSAASYLYYNHSTYKLFNPEKQKNKK